MLNVLWSSVIKYQLHTNDQINCHAFYKYLKDMKSLIKSNKLHNRHTH